MRTFPSLKLTYFDVKGLAEPIRVTLCLGDVPFVDERLTFAEFAAKKASLPYGKLPVLYVDDDEIAESQGILRYAARLANMYPVNDAVAAALVDEILKAVEEFQEHVLAPNTFIDDPEKKRQQREHTIKTRIPRYLGRLNTRLVNMSEYPLFKADAPKLFVHEVMVWSCVETIKSGKFDDVPIDLTSAYPAIELVHNKVASNPKVQQWLAHKGNVRPRTLKLTYLDMQNRAEQIRLAFYIAGIPFEDARMTHDELWKRANEFPYGCVPILEIDGVVVAQSFGLLRYAGTITGLYPANDPLQAAKIDEILSHSDEFLESTGPSFNEEDPVKQKAMRDQLTNVSFPRALEGLERRLLKSKSSASATGFAVGDQLTIADLGIYTLVNFLRCGLLTHVPTTLIDSYPTIVAVYNAVKSIPKVQEWYKTHAECVP